MSESRVDSPLVEFLAKELERTQDELPKLARTHMHALRLSRQADFDVLEVARLGEEDPSIATRLLQTANSSFHSRGLKIRNVEQAALRLGVRGVRYMLYVAVYAQMVFDVPRYRDLIHNSFRHSVIVARLARRIAALGDTDVDLAYLSGLLHDVGKARCYQLAAAHPEFGSDYEHVTAAVHRLHAKSGVAMIRDWSLPREVINAVARHHSPTSDALECCVALSDTIVHMVENPHSTPQEELDARSDAVGLRSDQVNYLIDNARLDNENEDVAA